MTTEHPDKYIPHQHMVQFGAHKRIHSHRTETDVFN